MSNTENALCLNADCIATKKHNDKRKLETITLSNGLSILFVSDPDMNKSSAAMDVAVGGLEDPEESPGMAHFLEHMLFLGTKKYPDASEYNKYLSSFQGHSNAYTSSMHTNYYFEVNHDGFAGALDRFAQFFIAPLFNEDLVERELNAVHSEHQKNLENDMWRVLQVHRGLYAKNHPSRKFQTGDKSTLAKVEREQLIAFHKKYYSANQMKLVLMSSLPHEKMMLMAKDKFSEIPNFDRETLTYPAKLYDDTSLPRLVKVKSIKDIRTLDLVFQVPDANKTWKSKPDHMLSHLIGHEGENSLLSLLKKESLALGLSCGVSPTVDSAGEIHTKISLTEKGRDQYKKVIAYFFQYIKMLKSTGLSESLYRDRKAMANLEYTFQEPEEGGSVASRYASRMHVHQALKVDLNDQLFFEYNPEDYDHFLSHITPSRANIFLIDNRMKTTLKEKYYGTEYDIEDIDSKDLALWKELPLHPELKLPPTNPFIPENIKVSDGKLEETSPEKLIDSEWGLFWYQQDDQFDLPKAHIQLDLLTAAVNRSPLDKALSLLYVRTLNEQLNEWNYMAGLAGLHFDITRTDRGIRLTFEGYSEKIPQLMSDLSRKLLTPELDESRFETIKNDLKRAINNSAYDAAYLQLIYEMKDLSRPLLIHRNKLYNEDERNKVDLISSIKMDDIKAFAQKVFEKFAIEGAAYSSQDKEALKAAILEYTLVLNGSPLHKSERPVETTYKFKEGEPQAAALFSKNNNHCWGESLQFGSRNPKLNAAIRIGQAHLETSFFNTLRTKQQLGYLVWSGLNYHENVLGLLYLIQSNAYEPHDIAKRVEEWRSLALSELKNMKAKQFETLRASVISELSEKDKTMSARLNTLLFEAVTVKEQFKYNQKIADAAKSLTRDEMIEIFEKAFHKKASLSVYLNTKEDHAMAVSERLITDRASYKERSPRY